jgi:nitrite reductase/ring-hydroxylating ferredoxin subunit
LLILTKIYVQVKIHLKVAIFFIGILLVITSGSCYKKNDVIPYTYVDFTVDTANPIYSGLDAFGGAVIVDASSVAVPGTYKSGYNGNGIIVFAGVDGEYYAYDTTCPYEYTLNKASIAVKLDPSSSIFAVCPKCGTRYALSANGTPQSGPGRYPLKNFLTSYDGRYVKVWSY